MTNTAIIFDLDGTLWDSTASIRDIWNAVIERETHHPAGLTQDSVRALMGKTIEDIALCLFPDCSESERARLIGLCGQAECNELRVCGGILYDGLEDTLKTLSSDRSLYIVSNCQDGYVQAFLAAHSLAGYFADIEMYGRTRCPKGENIRLLMERNHVTSAVYVGDTASDQQAAALAGVPFIHAAYGFGTVSNPDAVLARITDLPACIARLEKEHR